jgi:hypothetical protein
MAGIAVVPVRLDETDIFIEVAVGAPDFGGAEVYWIEALLHVIHV